MDRKDAMAAIKNDNDVLNELLCVASPGALIELIKHVTAYRSDLRVECLDFLETRVPASPEQAKAAVGEIVLEMWEEIASDIGEMDELGGGDYELVDSVEGALYDIREKLVEGGIDAEARHALIEEALPYIESGNSGLEDALYDLAGAACYNEGDWRILAEALEKMGDDWHIGQARGIYRKLGDGEKYLALRRRKMEYGADYHDLATYYWETGEKGQALAAAEEGLKKGQGRLDELRIFLAERAKESGDREKWLALEFAQAASELTLEKYQIFGNFCGPDEWVMYEPKILDCLGRASEQEQLKIRMHRGEHELAAALLVRNGYFVWGREDSFRIQAAKRLEAKFPEEMLKFYMTGLGDTKANATRSEYAVKAGAMERIRRLMVDVLGDEDRWKSFAGKVKRDNARRPAFQVEFTRKVGGWRDLT